MGFSDVVLCEAINLISWGLTSSDKFFDRLLDLTGIVKKKLCNKTDIRKKNAFLSGYSSLLSSLSSTDSVCSKAKIMQILLCLIVLLTANLETVSFSAVDATRKKVSCLTTVWHFCICSNWYQLCTIVITVSYRFFFFL